MAPEPRIARDPKLPIPPGLNEEEQQATMLKAAKQRGGVHKGEELTVLPADAPPLGGGWRSAGTIPAPGSGKPYRIYVKGPPRRGPGPTGTRNKLPVSDVGTMAVTENKPNVPTGASPGDAPEADKNPAATSWLGAVASEGLTEAAEQLKEVLDNPDATEDQIGDKVRGGLAAARQVELLGGDENKTNALMRQVGKAMDRVATMRNDAFEKVIQQEERTPGSVSDDKFKEHIQKVLGSERQRQLMGAAEGPSKALELTSKAIGIVADRKADALQNLLDQDKRSPGSVTETRFSTAIQELLGITRQSELMGMSRPKTDNALANVGEVMKVILQRKTEARNKLIRQKDVPGSGVTDEQIQQATDDLEKMKQQARRLGMSVP